MHTWLGEAGAVKSGWCERIEETRKSLCRVCSRRTWLKLMNTDADAEADANRRTGVVRR